MAMICQRVIAPASKLDGARAWPVDTGRGAERDRRDEDDLYAALDWLLDRQEKIEDRLAAGISKTVSWCSTTCRPRILRDTPARWRGWGIRVMASAARRRSFTGCCVTSPAGRSRSRFSPEQLHDDATLPAQIAKLKQRFGLARVVVVADRGMVTKANIDPSTRPTVSAGSRR